LGPLPDVTDSDPDGTKLLLLLTSPAWIINSEPNPRLELIPLRTEIDPTATPDPVEIDTEPEEEALEEPLKIDTPPDEFCND